MVDLVRRRAPAFFLVFLMCGGTALAGTEQVRRSTEYPSSIGKYNDDLRVVRKLTLGVRATAAGDPVNSGQSLTTVNGNVNIQTGNVVIDELLRVDGETLRVYPHDGWGGTRWTGINVDPLTLIGAAPNQRTRVEMEVNGNVFAKHLRAAPGFNYSDELLYFGVSSDGLWVEMGSKAGFRDSWGIPGDYADPASAARFNGNPKIVLNYYSTNPADILNTGNVGIGTQTPAYKLQVGDPTGPTSTLKAVAHSWEGFSSREFKADIRPLSPGDRIDLVEALDALKIVRFRYKDERPSSRQRIGVIAEEAPGEVLSHDGTTLSLTDSIGFVVAAVQELSAQQIALEFEVSRLEKEISSLEKKAAVR